MRDARTAKRKRGKLRSFVTLVTIGLAVAAIVKELRLPQGERTWNGKVASFVPYDFRMPTIERAKLRWFNPTAPVVGPRIFGVGWTLNVGRIWALVEAKAAAAAE